VGNKVLNNVSDTIHTERKGLELAAFFWQEYTYNPKAMMEKRLPVENWHPPSIKSVKDSLKEVVVL
jgi:hypothetical protein